MGYYRITVRDGIDGIYEDDCPRNALKAWAHDMGYLTHDAARMLDERGGRVQEIGAHLYQVMDTRGKLVAIYHADDEAQALECATQDHLGMFVRPSEALPFTGDLVWDGAVRLYRENNPVDRSAAEQAVVDTLYAMARAVSAGESAASACDDWAINFDAVYCAMLREARVLAQNMAVVHDDEASVLLDAGRGPRRFLTNEGRAAVRSWIGKVAMHPVSYYLPQWYGHVERAARASAPGAPVTITMAPEQSGGYEPETLAVDPGLFEWVVATRFYRMRDEQGRSLAILDADDPADAQRLADMVGTGKVAALPFNGDLVRDGAVALVGGDEALVRRGILAVARALRDGEDVHAAIDACIFRHIPDRGEPGQAVRLAVLAAAQAVPVLSFDEVVSRTAVWGVPQGVIFDQDCAWVRTRSGSRSKYDYEDAARHEQLFLELISREYSSQAQTADAADRTEPVGEDCDPSAW